MTIFSHVQHLCHEHHFTAEELQELRQRPDYRGEQIIESSFLASRNRCVAWLNSIDGVCCQPATVRVLLQWESGRESA
jgi:hypothetical protein